MDPGKVPVGSGESDLFLRKSSGLVRQFSVFDGFIYSIYADSIVVAAALTYSVIWPFPKANIPLGILIVGLAFLPMFTVYSMLTSLMPRAGGDYVWQSRALGGFWGYILVFTPLLFGPWFYMASNVAPATGMVLAPLFISLDHLLGIPALGRFAVYLCTTHGTWWFYVFYLTFGAVVLSLGMRFYAKVQRWSFYVGIVAVATWVIMLVMTSSSEFTADFNRFMLNTLHWGNGAAYQQILQMAKNNGFHAVSLSHTSLGSSFLIGPALAYTFMYIAWVGTLVGEIGGVNQFKKSFRMFWGANIFAVAVGGGFLWLLLSRIGNQFFTSSNFVWATGHASAIPVAPYYGLFIMSLSKSAWVWLWIAIGLNAWFWMWPTNNMVMSTRVMFAMSYDRMLPAGIARVFGRSASPLIAIGTAYVGMLIMGYLYFFTSFSKMTLDMPLMTSIAFAASTLVGTLFPYLKTTKKMYADSPISKYKLAGIPLITISGILGLIYFGFMFYLYISDSRFGTNSALSAMYILGAIVVSAVIYFVYKLYRRGQGINTNLTYKEIPVDTEEGTD